MTDRSAVEGPLLVHGPRSGDYDFGPGHPLTPRRFGPGIDLLRAVGARPGLAPEPATDAELLPVHTQRYLEAVRRFSEDPTLAPAFGIAPFGDVPPFAGMHEASAAVADGSIRAMAAILHGEVEHAFHPGGGLHHAMAERASGFCVYNDVALAIAAARRAGLRVMYVDLDVHHGDGVEAIHRDDPGVMTLSVHESGRYLFPGSGPADDVGEGMAAGTVVNVPLEPMTGETAWLAAIRSIAPALEAAFGPDLIMSQHGSDSHAFDPLAHLRVTTTAMGEAARIVDRLAHRSARGRWLATGGGGYDVYRVVPRAWTLTWLAGAHRDVPDHVPVGWRERWAAEAARWDGGPPPEWFDDPPNAGLTRGAGQDVAEAAAAAVVEGVRSRVLPRLLIVAEARGWWSPLEPADRHSRATDPSAGIGAGSGGDTSMTSMSPTILAEIDRAMLDRLRLAARTIAPADVASGRSILAAAIADGCQVTGAVAGDQLVGIALVLPGSPDERPGRIDELVTVGVAPGWRGHGLGSALARAAGDAVHELGAGLTAAMGPGDRDPVEPLALADRRAVGDRVLGRAGLEPETPDRTGGPASRRRYRSRR